MTPREQYRITYRLLRQFPGRASAALVIAITRYNVPVRIARAARRSWEAC